MNSRSPDDPVAKALALDGDADRIKDFYGDWARSYDDDVASEDYRAPEIIASLARLIQLSWLGRAPADLRVMDAGCGTGLAGIALRSAGFPHVDGFDIAPAMTAKAEKTGAYGRLLAEIDLNADDPGLGALNGTYDIVTCAGVFTLGHVAPEGLRHLFALSRHGGFVIISTRESYLNSSDFRGYVRQMERAGEATLIFTLPDASYVGDDRADYWVFRKLPA
ncbi:MAG: class I SAM-dependent methyltransferase [Rhizobiaceae bacterium]|nr:class I SAM-dependent methyltransferase [Rhizobiaceae bacterium]